VPVACLGQARQRCARCPRRPPASKGSAHRPTMAFLCEARRRRAGRACLLAVCVGCSCLLPACRLPSASCLLPPASCLLPPASCLGCSVCVFGRLGSSWVVLCHVQHPSGKKQRHRDTRPSTASPRLASPRLSSPHHTTLHHTTPHHTSPHHTSPHLTSPVARSTPLRARRCPLSTPKAQRRLVCAYS
jgi:hypothetical protein